MAKNQVKQLKGKPYLAEKIKDFLSLPETKKSHNKLISSNIAEDIILAYINNESISGLSEKYKISTNLIYRLLTDFYLYTSDDNKLEEIISSENSSHMNVLKSFFNSVSSLSQEITFNNIFSKKLRKEISEKLTTDGLEETLENTRLMTAWRDSISRTEKLIKLSTDQTSVYLNLLEKILDRQREVAFVKAVYAVLQELEPSVAVKVQEALYKDEYARAIIEATTTDELIGLIALTYNSKKQIQKSLEPSEEVLDVEMVEDNV
ncbi:MAG: hypothetical protein QXP88_00235 [Thermoproteota archaeon]